MPYIKKERKFVLDESCGRLVERIQEPGEMNYVFFKIAQGYLKKFGVRYATMNEILGVFDACAREFYRRLVAPYEDVKKQENGDVVDYKL
jgi:hypothetical protein